MDLEAGELLHRPLSGHDGDVNALALGELHGRPIVASGGNDRTVRLWDLVSGESLGAALQGHRRKVRAVAIGEFRGRPVVVSGSNDNTETHRDTDEPAAWRADTDRRRDEETALKPGVADPRTSPEPVMAGASASSMPSPRRR